LLPTAPIDTVEPQTIRRGFSVRGWAIFGAALAVFALAASMASAQTPARPLIDTAIDENDLVPLEGNTRPEATPFNDRGPVADSLPLEHLFLQLRRPAEREAALDQYIDGLTDPASPNYHRWLSASQVGTLYGPAPQDVATVTHWLAAHGFTVNLVYPNGMTIDFSGTAGQVREAFHTSIHNIEIDGESHIANMSDPQIPAALAPAVVGPVSLHDFHGKPAGHILPNFTVGSCGLDGSTLSSTCYFVTPQDLETIYDFRPVYSGGNRGKGQTIALIEDSDIYSRNDWTKFRQLFGLSGYAGTLTQTHPAPNGGGSNCSDPGANGDDFEATLDTEYASAAAPAASIEVASCADGHNGTWGLTIALQNVVNAATTPQIVNVSYIYCEASAGASNNAAYYDAFQQAASEGISAFVSAGDEGAATCDYGADYAHYGINANGLATTPYAVAVGGTDFGDVYHHEIGSYWNSGNGSSYGSARSYVPEIPWNNSCASQLIAQFVTGSAVTYGSSGFCNSSRGKDYFLTTLAGSGGPSSCGTMQDGNCEPYPKPSWQKILGNPADGARDTPDMALFAAGAPWGHAYIVCISDPKQDFGDPCTQFPGGWVYGYGTSFAAPVMAGIQALVNDAVGSRQGNPNPTLYKLANTEYGGKGNSNCNATLGKAASSSCVFYDITEGDMDVPCAKATPDCYTPSGTYGVLSTSDSAYQPAYRAGTGWDFATGIGSINVANLVKNWPR
jgi:subtilase family serine protease